MATYTPNYNLKKPALNDKIRIADFNGNADIIDGAMNDNATLIAQLKSDIGIVENTNTATHNISAGQYVIWKGSLYTASSAISSGATLSDANLTAVSGGGLNALNSNLNNRFKVVNSGSIKAIKTPGIYYLTSNVTDKPISGGGVYVVGAYNDDTVCGVFISEFTNEVYQIRNNANTITPYLLSIREGQVSGTTSSTGAISIPSDMINYKYLNALLTTGSPGFVIRRDYSYFTVFNNDGTPMGNTAVAFTAYFM